MTWGSFFDLSSMHQRHLVAAYAVAILTQGGYFGYILWAWNRTRSKINQ